MAYQGWGGGYQSNLPQQGGAFYHWPCLELLMVLMESRLTLNWFCYCFKILCTPFYCLHPRKGKGKWKRWERKDRKANNVYYSWQQGLILTGDLLRNCVNIPWICPSRGQWWLPTNFCPSLAENLRVYSMHFWAELACCPASFPLEKLSVESQRQVHEMGSCQLAENCNFKYT